MEKLVCVNENYRIWQLDKESLHELAEFVVTENYKHHVGSFTAASIKAEVDSVFQEELQYIDSSIIFAVRNMMGKIIGSIRVFKWDRKKTLPVQKIFGVNLWGIERSGFFNGREKWAKGFENQRV